MKKTILKSGLTFLIVIIVSACQDTTSSDNPVPGQVILVDKSAEYDSLETGIDAEHIITTERNGIMLQWHPIIDDNDLAAYRIYRSTVDTSTALTPIAEVKKSLGKIDTFYTDGNAEVGIRYYYRVSAIDEEDQEGPLSKSANYQLYEMCTLYAPPPFDGTFNWQWPTIPPPSFVFRLLKERSFGIYRVVLVREFLISVFDPEPVWSLSDLGLGSLGTGTYRWRIDIIGAEANNGSESEWSSFTVQ